MTAGTMVQPTPRTGISPQKRLLIGVILPVAIVIAITVAASRLFLFGKPLTEICHLTSTGWTRLPAPGGTATDLQVSSGGAVWASTFFPSSLSRLDNGAWHTYTTHNFGTSETAGIRDFVLDGERVLAATTEEVILFDGQRWQSWRQAIKTRNASSVVAGHDEFYAVDRDGNFSHYSGGTWRISRIQLPGVAWARHAYPKLAFAGGSVWLISQGLWRLDGAIWQAADIPSVPKQAQFAGVARDHVWLTTENKLWEVDSAGHLLRSYGATDLGLPNNAGLLRVAGRDGRTVIANLESLVESDGAGWRKLRIPDKVIQGIVRLDIAPDGSIWVIGKIAQFGLTRFAAWIAVIGIPLGSLAAVAGFIWYLAGARRKAKQDREHTREAVQLATGALPEDLQPGAVSRDSLTLVYVIVATLAISASVVYFLPRRWVGAFPALVVVIVVFEVVQTIAKSLERRHRKASDPIGPGGPPKYDLKGSILPILSGLALVALYFAIRWAPANSRFILLLVLIFGLPFAFQRLRRILARKADRAALQGQYDVALKLAPYVAQSAAGRALIRGDVLTDAGRYEEAESALREAIERAGTPIDRALSLALLASVLMDRGRYGEAQRCLEGATKILPERSKHPMIQAEILLRQGVGTTEALACSERAVELYDKSRIERRASPQRLGEILATKAWALAAVGRGGDARALLEQALASEAMKWNLTAAHVHYNGAMALHILGDESGADEHLKKGRDTNPNGRWGKLCAAALSASARGATRN